MIIQETREETKFITSYASDRKLEEQKRTEEEQLIIMFVSGLLVVLFMLWGAIN